MNENQFASVLGHVALKVSGRSFRGKHKSVFSPQSMTGSSRTLWLNSCKTLPEDPPQPAQIAQPNSSVKRSTELCSHLPSTMDGRIG
jgi:hypothetical protein